MKTAIAANNEDENVKKVGLYIRVSTPRQAAVQEGSLKNQQQLLEDFIRTKNAAVKRLAETLDDGSGVRWQIIETYIEEPRTATETSRRLEYQRMVADIKRGRVDTIVCLALNRVSRSVKDFLELIELLHKHDADFISLKEDFDSTTPQGKCFMIILLALYQFEAEIDSQRVIDSIKARSERGLWVAGQIIGYDLDAKRPGYLLVNEAEAKTVNIAFDKLIELGSAPKVAAALNKLGLRTKEYMSRRGKLHKSREFTFSSTFNLLRNKAYLGLREISKRSLDHKPKKGKKHAIPYRVVPGVWKPIVSKDKFDQVQRILDENERTGHNCVSEPKHLFLFNGGLLRCDMCGAEMKGASGTGKAGKVYPYYLCANKDCRFRIPATEVEDMVRWRLRHLCRDPKKLSALVERTNARLRSELPKIMEQREALRKELEEINAKAAGITARFMDVVTGDAARLVQEQLDGLMQRRGRVEEGLAALADMVKVIEADMVEKAVVQQALLAFDKVFEEAPPYLKKKFVKDLIGQIRLSDLRVAIGLDGKPGSGLVGPEKREPAPEIATQEAGSAGLRTGGVDGIRTRDLRLDRAACWASTLRPPRRRLYHIAARFR